MSVEEYGRHFSGYRKPEPGEPSRGFMRRLVFWSVVCAACIGWMLSHMGCAHPIGCFASMFVRQVRQCFSAVWADGFPRCRHRFPVM